LIPAAQRWSQHRLLCCGKLAGDKAGRHHLWLGGSGTHGPSRSEAGTYRLPREQIPARHRGAGPKVRRPRGPSPKRGRIPPCRFRRPRLRAQRTLLHGASLPRPDGLPETEDRDRRGEWTRSAHRAIKIREKRRQVLSSHPASVTLALQPKCAPSVTGCRTPVRVRLGRHLRQLGPAARSAGMMREAPTQALLHWFRGGSGVVSGLGPGLTSDPADAARAVFPAACRPGPSPGIHRCCRSDLPGLCKRPGFTGPAASGCVPSLNCERDGYDHHGRRHARHHWRCGHAR